MDTNQIVKYLWHMGTSSYVSCPSCFQLALLAFIEKIISIHEQPTSDVFEVSGNFAIHFSRIKIWIPQILF